MQRSYLLLIPCHDIFLLSSYYPENTLNRLPPGMDSPLKKAYCYIVSCQGRDIIRQCRSVLSGSGLPGRKVSTEEQGWSNEDR